DLRGVALSRQETRQKVQLERILARDHEDALGVPIEAAVANSGRDAAQPRPFARALATGEEFERGPLEKRLVDPLHGSHGEGVEAADLKVGLPHATRSAVNSMISHVQARIGRVPAAHGQSASCATRTRTTEGPSASG